MRKPFCRDGRLMIANPKLDDPLAEDDIGPCEDCEERDALQRVWREINVLGGYRPSERNYDQGYVDAIGAALAVIERHQSAEGVTP